MLRWTVACAILFFCTARLAANELAVFVNDEDHFVLSSDGIELLGVQLESASGSLIPDLTGDTGPFQLQMQNDSNIVMFGSLGAGVQVDGSMILPTRWNPTGMRDVGFRWGSPDDDGFGAVAGHSPETVSPARPTVVPDEPNEPIRQQDVAAAIVVESTDSADADKFPGILTLYPQPNDGHLELHVYDDPEIESFTVTSNRGLLTATSASDAFPFTLASQNGFQATFGTPTAIPDGVYELPLAWAGGSDFVDLGLSIVAASQQTPFVEIETGTSRALPEPSGEVMTLLSVLLLLPALRRK